MGLLSHDEFFARLGELFNSRKGKEHGAVYLTQKRLTYDGTAKPASDPSSLFSDLKPEQPLPIIIRASNGKPKEGRKEKVKLSTKVQADELETFYARYAETCKTGMVALKPRDRSKKKAKARKKKGTAGAGGA